MPFPILPLLLGVVAVGAFVASSSSSRGGPSGDGAAPSGGSAPNLFAHAPAIESIHLPIEHVAAVAYVATLNAPLGGAKNTVATRIEHVLEGKLEGGDGLGPPELQGHPTYSWHPASEPARREFLYGLIYRAMQYGLHKGVGGIPGTDVTLTAGQIVAFWLGRELERGELRERAHRLHNLAALLVAEIPCQSMAARGYFGTSLARQHGGFHGDSWKAKYGSAMGLHVKGDPLMSCVLWSSKRMKALKRIESEWRARQRGRGISKASPAAVAELCVRLGVFIAETAGQKRVHWLLGEPPKPKFDWATFIMTLASSIGQAVSGNYMGMAKTMLAAADVSLSPEQSAALSTAFESFPSP
jgi:hypothetical protein